VNKNNLIVSLAVSVLVGSAAVAQTKRNPAQEAPAAPAASASANSSTAAKAPAKKAPAAKKNIKIDFENETVTGTYDVPDASFINSRKMIKYKELFNKRTNFIDEIDANKGLFNEY